MARIKLPDPLQRRHWLEQELSPERATAVAEAYVEAGRLVESLAFFERAGNTDRLRALQEEAIAAGDVFLLREITVFLGEEPDAEAWRRLGAAATAAGKLRYAQEAERQLAAREG